MSSSLSFGRLSALLLPLTALLGCAEPPATPAKPAAVAVVEEVVETVAPEPATQPSSAAIEAAPAPADQAPPAAGGTEAPASAAAVVVDDEPVTSADIAPRIAELVRTLTGADTDARGRVVALDELAALRADSALEPIVATLTDTEPTVRWHAARAVGLMGPAAVSALPALVKLLADSDPVVITQAAAAIGHIRRDDDRSPVPPADAAIYAAAVEPLVATLVHPDPRARRAAVRALRRVSTSRQELAQTVRRQLADADPIAVMPALHTLADMGADAVPFLVESLEDPASRYWAEVVLAEIGPAAAAAVEPLSRLAGEGEIADRVQSILALAEIGPPAAAAVEPIIEALGSSDVALQYVAAFALGKIGSDKADEPLASAAASADPFLAALASWARATLHPDDAELVALATTRLRDGLASESPAVRNAAVEGLSDLAPRLSEAERQSLAESFVELLDDPVPTVGLAAGGGLIRLGSDAVTALRAALADQPARNDALEILAALGPAALPALDDLVAGLADSDPVSRSDAAFAIAAIGQEAKGAVAALEKILGDESAEAPVRYSVAYALGKIGPGAVAAEPLLRKLVDCEDDLLATVSVWAAVQIKPGDKDLIAAAVPKLRQALQDEQELVRLEAAIALGEIGPAAGVAVPMLELLAEDDPSSQVREAAEAALGLIQR